MTKKDLVRIIREVVKREIKSVVQSEINEALNILENKQSQKQPSQIDKEMTPYTKNAMLNEVLNETVGFGKGIAKDNEWNEIPQQAIRDRFASVQGGAAPMTDINNRPVNTNNLDPTLNKALNRDYSELVKRFK
jgi:DNA topoisomerase VI subunit B